MEFLRQNRFVLPLLTLLVAASTCVEAHHSSLFLRLVGAAGSPQQLGGVHLTMSHGDSAAPAAPIASATNAAAESEEPPVPELSRKLAQELENYRRYLGTGGEGMPQLDPLHAQRLPPIKLSYLGVRAILKLSDVDIRGLQSFQLNSIDVRLKPPRIDFDLSFPSLQLDAQYYLRASLLLNFITYDPRGRVSAMTGGVRTRGSAAWDIVSAMSDDSHFALTGFQMSLDIDSVELSLTGLMPSDAINGAMNAVVNMFSDAALEQLHSQIAGYASDLAAEKVNGLLANFSASYLIKKVAFD